MERQPEAVTTIASPNGSSKNFSHNGRLPAVSHIRRIKHSATVCMYLCLLAKHGMSKRIHLQKE